MASQYNAIVCFCDPSLFSEMLNKVTSTMVDGGGQGAGEQVENLILQSSKSLLDIGEQILELKSGTDHYK